MHAPSPCCCYFCCCCCCCCCCPTLFSTGTIGSFLQKAIEPPTKESIDHVIAVLKGLTALDSYVLEGTDDSKNQETKQNTKKNGKNNEVDNYEELTPLGVLLASLPVDPRIGKMMLYVQCGTVRSFCRQDTI